MHLRVYFFMFFALLVFALTVADGAQRSDVGSSDSDSKNRYDSRGGESKWHKMKRDLQIVLGKLQNFFTNDIPHFFNEDVPDYASPVKGFVKKEVTTVENEIEDIENTVEGEFRVIRFQTPCACVKSDCGCCQHLEEPSIHLNSTICANVSYLSEDIGISVTVTVNGYAIFNETVSVRNPPPVCLGVPYVKEWAEACVRFYDIEASKSHLHACAEVEARMKHILIAKYELGCFDIGPTQVKTGPELEQQSGNEQPSVMLV